MGLTRGGGGWGGSRVWGKGKSGQTLLVSNAAPGFASAQPGLQLSSLASLLPRFSMMDFANRAVTALIALFCIAAAARAQEASSSTVPTVIGQNGMVVAQESRAARVGIDILQKGGNAVDAAVATGFALAVTYPRAGNLGGGGYMVIHLARENLDTTIDYRERSEDTTSDL